MYDKTHFAAAHRLMRLTPIALSEADLLQLAIIDPTLEIKARTAQREAQLAIVRQHSPVQQTKGTQQDHRSGILHPKTPTPRALTGKDLAKFADVFGTALVGVLKETVVPLKQQIAELTARIKDLESRPMLKYAGVWRSDHAYTEGYLTTHKGALWLAVCTTDREPGTEASGFRLIVKSGGAAR